MVSALNELIAIKSELGVLQDRQPQPKRIREYDIRVEYDELVVADEDGDIFKYDPSNPSSQRIQETLFEEKRTIIENCLFGVDLNPKSVDICQLRLWIELLKNAYYYKTETGERLLQTLPNIDINIKCGNSLASAHPVCIGRKITESFGMQKLVRDYKANVREYKNCRTKAIKNRLDKDIKDIKLKLAPPVQLNAFENDNDKIIDTQEILKKSLEWMVEFPEVLNEQGAFEGFDVIIGNPPYISLEKLRKDAYVYSKMHRTDEQGHLEQKTYNTLESRGDIYSLFVERGLHLLRKGGHLSYIMPNKWEKVMYGRPLRELFLNTNLSQLIDFGDNQIFEDATTYTCIIRMKKERQDHEILVSTIENINPETLHEDVEEEKEKFDTTRMSDDIWVISSLDNFNAVERLKTQMTTLGEFGGESYRGILSGLSKAFNISKEKANELIAQDYRSKDVVRPFLQGRGLVAYGEAVAGSYLIFTPKGFTLEGMGIEISDEEKKSNKNWKTELMPSEEEAWLWFSSNYSAVANWLSFFKKEAKKRQDKGDYWWELRACDYYDQFAKHKLFYQVFQTKPCFVYDESSTFCNNSMYFMTVPDKALMALLCSKIGWWLITEFCPRIQNGAQLIWDNFRQIPIPQELPHTLNEYADKMMSARNDEVEFQRLSKEIDKIVSSLYGLAE